jgi:hypothetical protein
MTDGERQFSAARPATRGLKRCAAFFCLAALGLLVLPPRSAGIGAIGLRIGDIQGSGWHAHGVNAQLTLSDPLSARITVDRLVLDGLPEALEQVVVTCRAPGIRQPRLRCPDARISGQLGPLGRQRLRADVTYDTTDRSLRLRIRDLSLAGGRVRLEGHWAAPTWTLAVHARDLDLQAVQKLASPWLALPEGFSLSGHGALQATLHGGRQVRDIDASISLEALTVSNAEGTLATDGLALTLEAALQTGPDGWSIQAGIRSAVGQAYVDPIFVDLGAHALRADLAGRWSPEDSVLYIERLRFDQAGIARGRAAGEIAPAATAPLRRLSLELEDLALPGAYTVLMQPFLLDTDFRDLEASGRLAGTLDIGDNAPLALDLSVHEVTARDKQGKLGIEGLRGRLAWHAGPVPASGQDAEMTSHLAWNAAHAYGLTGGGARLDFVAANRDFRLLQSAFLPVLDGGLFIRALDVREAGDEKMSLRFEGELRPIGMPLLCRAFGWPEFAGTLSGRIPEVHYDEGVLSVGGTLQASAFDGQVRVEGLELREPLGRFPRLKADITLRGLDLEAVTGTFSFGSITGRLDGDIMGLELFQWSPVRMDARLYTPPGDKSRHLISQRAVKNLSSIGGGGGVAAALQGGFLRFFENFRYRRLGLSCRLENEVCHMDGVGRTDGDSYYIVQGSGLPRIDVVGHARRMNWPQLVEQLKAIETSDGPVVR